MQLNTINAIRLKYKEKIPDPNSRLKINLISIQANAKQYRLSGDLEWLALLFNNLYIAILSLYLYRECR